MAARVSRFVDGNVDLMTAPGSLNIKEKIAENLPMLMEYFEEEKSASSTFADAWSQASDTYTAKIEPELCGKDKKRINKELADELPESLKQKPTYLPIAVIVCTQEPQAFFDEYNKAVRAMFAGNDWDSFSFRGFFLLLSLAVKLLPSRPGKQLGKFAFRGLDTDREFTVGEEFSLGYTAPFTVKRFLALGKQPQSNDDEEEEDEGTNENDDSLVTVGGSPTKTILKVKLDESLSLGLGVRHLSEQADKEKEVLVLPQQSFKVLQVKNRQKKGFKVVTVQVV